SSHGKVTLNSLLSTFISKRKSHENSNDRSDACIARGGSADDERLLDTILRRLCRPHDGRGLLAKTCPILLRGGSGILRRRRTGCYADARIRLKQYGCIGGNWTRICRFR